MKDWTAEGKKLGKYAESLEYGTHPDGAVNDQIHHIGDDTGKLLAEAYHTDGLPAAVDVLVGYFDEYNANRAAHGTPELTAERASANLGWALPSDSLTPEQIEEIRQGFRQRRP